MNLGVCLLIPHKPDTQIQTPNATDITCHSREPGGHAVSYHTT